MFWGNLSFRSVFIQVKILNSQWLIKCKIKPSQKLLSFFRLLACAHMLMGVSQMLLTFKYLEQSCSWALENFDIYFSIHWRKKYKKGKVNRKWLLDLLYYMKCRYASRFLWCKSYKKTLWKSLSVTFLCSGLLESHKEHCQLAEMLCLLFTKYYFAVNCKSVWLILYFLKKPGKTFC